jgi:hypothetical protein
MTPLNNDEYEPCEAPDDGEANYNWPKPGDTEPEHPDEAGHENEAR